MRGELTCRWGFLMDRVQIKRGERMRGGGRRETLEGSRSLELNINPWWFICCGSLQAPSAPPAVGPCLLALDLDVKGWAAAQCALASASLAGGEVTWARAGAEPGPDEQGKSMRVCVCFTRCCSYCTTTTGGSNCGEATTRCHTHRGQWGLTESGP